MTELTNNPDLKFVDISSEEWRIYYFDDDLGVKIDEPVAINRSSTGHRIVDASGIAHFIPNAWIQLKWKVKEEAPYYFVF